MKKYVFLLFWILTIQLTFAQQVIVPQQITFADLVLDIDKATQDILQYKTDSIQRNPQKVQLLRRRLQIYAPLITPILQDKKLHSDFQYLMTLESGVEGNFEHQNRVGFWSLSEERATEIGLQIHNPDLRKHLTIASEHTAQFFANNQYYLRNSLYTVLTHKIGLIQVNKLITNNIKNKSEITIDKNIPPYLLDFIAHLLVFKTPNADLSDLQLLKFDNTQQYSIVQIAQLTGLTTEEILTFNEWVIDVHKSYPKLPVLLPIQPENCQHIMQELGYNENQITFFESKNNTKLDYPIILNKERVRFQQKNYMLATVNGLRGVLITETARPADLATLGNITVSRFLKINDMSEFDNVQEGKVYYFESKKNKVSVEKYTLQQEETFWDVAQKFGLKLNIIIKNNAIGRSEFPKAGKVLFLNQKSPKNSPHLTDFISEARAKINLHQNHSKDTLLYYTVKKGETLFQIAKKYQVSMTEIRNWNNLSNNLKLVEGKVLKIMKLNTVSTVQKVQPKAIVADKSQPKIEYTRDSLYILHTVRNKETPYQIAQKYNVTTEAILKWNNLKTRSILLNGDKIRIKVRDGQVKKPEPFFRQPIPITTYLVVKPESMTRIAYKLNIPLNRLAKWNPTQSMQTELITGTKLSLKDTIHVYNAGFGESIETIAKHLQIEAREIARWNRKAMTSYAISIGGEQLVLKPYGEKQKVIPPGYIEPEQITSQNTPTDSLKNTKNQLPEFHVLEPAQRLKQVAQKYNLDEKQLIVWNHLTASDLQALSTGDTVFLNQTSALFAKNQAPWNKTRFQSPYNFGLYEIIPADYHIYRKGETLKQISTSEAVKLDKIKLWNQVPDNVLFVEGDTLLLTNPIYLEKKKTQSMTAPAKYQNLAGAFYVAKQGDNIYTVADKFDIKISELRAWNGLPREMAELREGMRLVVKLREK